MIGLPIEQKTIDITCPSIIYGKKTETLTIHLPHSVSNNRVTQINCIVMPKLSVNLTAKIKTTID